MTRIETGDSTRMNASASGEACRVSIQTPIVVSMKQAILREAVSHGVLLHEAFALANVGYWLQHID